MLFYLEYEFLKVAWISKRSVSIRRKDHTAVQIAFALRQSESGMPVSEIVRKLGLVEVTFYCWKQKFDGLGVGEVRRLKQLEEQSRKLNQLVADLSLDKSMLQDALKVKL